MLHSHNETFSTLWDTSILSCSSRVLPDHLLWQQHVQVVLELHQVRLLPLLHGRTDRSTMSPVINKKVFLSIKRSVKGDKNLN